MRYYLSFGKTFRISLLWLFFSVAYIAIYASRDKPQTMDYFIVVLYGYLLISIILPRIIKFLYFIIRKRPALTVTESFVFDHYKNIKYDWNDINEIQASDNYLDIKLHEPWKYYGKIWNPFLRLKIMLLSNIFKNKSFYKIDIDILDIKKGENKKFLDAINEFSMAACE